MPRGLMGRSQRRRAVAAAVAVVVTFGVAACGGDDTKKESASSSAEATPTVKVIYSLYPAVLTSVTGANLVGQGFDKANGFKAEITPLATTGAEQMVLRRQADASFDAVSNGLGIYGAGGKDLRLIGLNTQHSSSMWCVREDSDIKSVADLKGKKVATAAAPTTNLLLNMMLDQGGLKESDIKRVNTKAIVDSVTAVQNGVVDAAWCIQPLVAISNHANKPLRVIWKAAENTPNMSDAIFTSAKLIEEQPETVQKFMDGVAQSHQFIQQQTERPPPPGRRKPSSTRRSLRRRSVRTLRTSASKSTPPAFRTRSIPVSSSARSTRATRRPTSSTRASPRRRSRSFP